MIFTKNKTLLLIKLFTVTINFYQIFIFYFLFFFFIIKVAYIAEGFLLV